MTGGPYSITEPERVPITDLYPDAVSSEEVDLRIAGAEARIKFWVVACVATNLILSLPTIFYIGRMAQSVDEMSSSVKDLQTSQKVNDIWVRDRLVWEARVEAAMQVKAATK